MRAAFAISVCLALLACNSTQPSAKGPGRGGFPASPVTAAKAEQRDVPVQLREIGSVDPVAVIAVKAQIGGALNKVFFKEGDDIRGKGQPLFEIDPRPYQQAIDQAQASIEKDNALISQAQANLARDRVQTANAKEQADRYEALAKDGLISKDQNSTYQTTFNSQTGSPARR